MKSHTQIMNHYKNEIVAVNGTQHKNLENSFIKQCHVGDDILLVREHENVHDKNAIAVMCNGQYIGYIPRQESGSRLAHILDSGRSYQAELSQVAAGNKHHIFSVRISTFPNTVERPPKPIQSQSCSQTRSPSFFTQNHTEAIKEAKNKCGIYHIVCKNGKSYVGQSIHIGVRWQKHIHELTTGFHSNAALAQDWAKLGARQFRFEIIEECLPGILDEREKFHIDRLDSYHSGYNATIDGQGLTNYERYNSSKQPPADKVIEVTKPGTDSNESTTIKQYTNSYRAIKDGERSLPTIPSSQSVCSMAPEQKADKPDVSRSPEKTMAVSFDTQLRYAYELKKRFPDVERIVTSSRFNRWLRKCGSAY